AGVDCFSEGSEPTELTASPVPAARTAITIAARYSVLIAMVAFVGPSPQTNRALSEMVPNCGRCLRSHRSCRHGARRLAATRFLLPNGTSPSQLQIWNESA